jgi:post-segregation antitoxin (ccd killing protein)
MGPARSLSKVKKQRTTLTLPSDSLTKAKSIARARKVNLSTVISEALSEGLKAHAATERSEEVLATTEKLFRASRTMNCRFWTALYWNRQQGVSLWWIQLLVRSYSTPAPRAGWRERSIPTF